KYFSAMLAKLRTAFLFALVGWPMATALVASHSGTMLQVVASGNGSRSLRRSLYQRSCGFHQFRRVLRMPFLAGVQKSVADATGAAQSITSAARLAISAAVFRGRRTSMARSEGRLSCL